MEIEDADDPMEIDDVVPTTPIIERSSEKGAKNSRVSGTPTTAAQNDVVVLIDDDEPVKSKPTDTAASQKKNCAEEPQEEVIIDLIPKNTRCMNTNCKGKSDKYVWAPDFCLSYFRVKKSKSSQEEICCDCYNQAVEDYDKLAIALKEGTPLFDVPFPIINETLQIEDSDEESEEREEMDYLSEENFKFISENIDQVLDETLQKFDINKRMKMETEYLEKENASVAGSCEELSKKVKEVRGFLDKLQIDLYNRFKPDIKNLNGISITDDFTHNPTFYTKQDQDEVQRKSTRVTKPVNYSETAASTAGSQSASPAKSKDTVEAPKDLPRNMSIEKHPLKIGEIYYTTRENSTQLSWVRARLLQIIPPGNVYNGESHNTMMYKMVELKKQIDRFVSGKQLAYLKPCNSMLPVGTRVISVFKETSATGELKKARSDPYYAGIVGEQPIEGNNYRYLIFFDIGYAQYVPHQGINLVYEASTNVWDDMPTDSRPFIKKYLESQDRPMVKLSKDQTVKVEYNGKWWMCTVLNVDCSLVQVFFDALSRMEWIYRGSTRLSPMFREEQAATNRHTARAARKIGHNESAAVVQYTRNNDFLGQKSPPSESTSAVRAVARKSTTKPNATTPVPNIVPFLPPVNNLSHNSSGPTSKIMYFTPRDQAVTKKEYKPHECGPTCRGYLTHNFTKLKGHNPLSKPLLCGWARMTVKDRGRKQIVYKAPCGRMIRNMDEIHYYLRITESEMTVDLFDFNHLVRCLAEFSVECTPDPKDLSKGLEQVPIPVINGISNKMLDFCNYSTKRVPMEGVHVNLDPEFLCGCDCEDDCADKLKCSCWKLTLEGAKYVGKDVDPISVGYIYRRLQDQVITGIYECNSRCKCKSTCLNRVVQNPLSLKLQVFRTHNRGWGIRCLNDIPQGTFICIYAGTLHTEQTANENGMQYGDEYFAELDYIETVEKFKEDYEEDVVEDDDYREKTPPPEEKEEPKSTSGKKGSKNKYDEDNDFLPNPSTNLTSLSANIRTRLRKRNDDDKSSETVVVKKEPERDIKAIIDKLGDNVDTVTISDDEDEGREVLSFNPKTNADLDDRSKYISIRELFGSEERDNIYIMDAKNAGNIGRFLNHSCAPNVFVQNVFVDTHDLRFPWVAFFSSQFIRAGTELTWNYSYDIGSVPGRVLYCHCASLECKGRLL